MNDQLDVISRLVDYHDHISAPSAQVTDDLRRGRRRVRRRRGLVAGGVALGVASVVAAVSLATGADSGDRTEPSGPSTSATPSAAPDGLGLTAPLVAPKSLLDVRELGFHVEPVPGFDPEGLGGGWAIDDEGQTVTLRWGEVADEVTVNVRYPGASPGDPYGSYSHHEAVTIHGVVAHYYEEPGGFYGYQGAFAAYVAWEYAPDAWAYVSAHSDRGDPGSERLRSALIQVAEAVKPGGEPLRVPVRTDAFPASLPAVSSPDGVHLASDGSTDMVFGPLRLTVDPGAGRPSCDGYDGGHVGTFIYRGHAGCVNGSDSTGPGGKAFNTIDAVSLQIGDTVRTVVPSQDNSSLEYRIPDLKQALAGLTVAPLDNQSTWFDLKTALGGGQSGQGS
jgi:hypothetical protein